MQRYGRRTVWLLTWMASLTFVGLAGCEKRDPIRRYQVEREIRPAEASRTATMPPATAEPSSAEQVEPARPDSAAAAPAVTAPPSSGDLQYEVPEGWKAGNVSVMRLAAFNIERNGKTAEVTVIRLGPAAGSLLDNVNRWRGQIGLEPIAQAELDATTEKLDVGGIESSYMRIVPPEGAGETSSILAVVIPRSDQTLFVKLIGDRGLAAEEQAKFEQFVRSMHFAGSP